LKCYHASDFSAEVDPPTPEGSNIVVPDNAEIVGVGGDIQAKIDLLSSLGGGTVTIEDGTFLIDTVSAPILMKSNIKLHLSANTILEALPTAEEHYDVIYCYDITNWEITGGKIIGDRLSHTGATGEFGYGIRVSSCLTYRIADIDLSNCWGDGIIIGGSKPSMLWSEDGYLDNVYSHNNRRQGLSIISVKGLRINSACRFTDTNGTAPQAGIDFEPINPGNFIQGVVIDGAEITNNLGWGIDWWFYHLIGGTNLVTIEIKNCTVTGNTTGQIRYSEGFPENASYKAYLRISVDGVYL
jgi:polygalacturonase